MRRTRIEKKTICRHLSDKKQVTLWMHREDANVPTKGRRFPSAHGLDLNVSKAPFRWRSRRPNTKGVAGVHGGVISTVWKTGCQLPDEILSRSWRVIGEDEEGTRCGTTNSKVSLHDNETAMVRFCFNFQNNRPVAVLMFVMTDGKLLVCCKSRIGLLHEPNFSKLAAKGGRLACVGCSRWASTAVAMASVAEAIEREIWRITYMCFLACLRHSCLLYQRYL